MAKWSAVVLLLFSILFCFEAHSGFLDFEELASVNYGIDIIDKPVMAGKEPPGAIVLRSKFGQQYQCSYVDRVKEDERQRQEQQDAIDTGIPDLLKPMAHNGCLVYPKDWWTYEFCYGKHVKQYHIEDSKIVGNVIYLGHYESEFDWSNITEKDKKRKYHSHKYTNGTLCDLTNKPRQVEVRFECEDGEADTVYEISEAQTCVYTLIIHTGRLCKHPYLKKAAPAKPVPITCNPLVSAEQYQEYLNTLQENMRREQEENARKTCKLLSTKEDGDNYIKKYKMIEDTSQADPQTVAHDAEQLHRGDSNRQQHGQGQTDQGQTDTNPIESDQGGLRMSGESEDESGPKAVHSGMEVSPVKKLIRDMLAAGSDGSTKANDGEKKVRVFTDASQLQKYIKEVVGNRKAKVAQAAHEGQTKGQPEGQENQDLEGQPEGQVNSDLEDDTQGQPLDSPQGQDSSELKDDSEGQIQGQGESLTEGQPQGEARGQGQSEGQEEAAETGQEAVQAPAEEEEGLADNPDTRQAGVELDDDEQIMAEFDKELNEIVDTAEKKAHMAQYKDTIESAMQTKFSDIVEETEQELANEGMDTPVDKQKAFSDLAKTLTKLLSRLQRTEREKRAVEKHLKKAQLLAAAARIRQQSKDPPPTTEQTNTPQAAPSTKQDTKTDIAQTEQNLDKLENNKDNTEAASTDHNTDDAEDTDGSDLTQLHSNRVRVRVTRLKRAPPGGGGEDGGKLGDGADDKQTLQIPDDQRKELETTVKSELEKAGLETKGQKIEVKIITAGYFDTNKEGVHVLSEEESSAFNNMIVSILGGNSQAAKEMTRQKQMEDAYGHVWGKTRKQKPTSETTDAAPTPTAAPPS